MEKCEIDARYAAFQIAPNELAAALALLPKLGFLGVNLTLPHKIAAATLVDELDAFARQAGAINTVRVAKGRLFGSNTDAPGFARALRSEFSVDLRDLRVLLLGAGGAARAIAWQCAAEGCPRLVIASRRLEAAQQLVQALRPAFLEGRVSAPAARWEAAPWEERALRSQIANIDLVVNATSLGLQPSDPSPLAPSLLLPRLLVYDTIYRPERTALVRMAAEAGARVANGSSMLLHQGALSFETWFARAAPLAEMRAALA